MATMTTGMREWDSIENLMKIFDQSEELNSGAPCLCSICTCTYEGETIKRVMMLFSVFAQL